MVEQEYIDLLQEWCDTLLTYQIQGTGNSRFDGALLCPSCMVIHGRCHDAVYPLLCLADITGEDKYIKAARQLFDWGGNLLCDDGSFYNDAQSEWNGITVFTVMGLYDSLHYHGNLLNRELKYRFEERFKCGAEWVYETITPDFKNNINYQAAAAGALAAAGMYFHKPYYLERAEELAKLCQKHITEDGLLYGEGIPQEALSNRGCRPIDIGYNVEESLPSLLIYARICEDKMMLQMVRELLHTHLDFMMPDGAWDNSMGTRNYKWTYWGSRTSDGCQSAYGTWGESEPVFAEAARRNLALYKKCTHNGLLYGGPDYYEHGEEPCIHHTFCHAKALATVLDQKEKGYIPQKLPIEKNKKIRYYPSIDTYKIPQNSFIATITGYDSCMKDGSHASGGCITLLWHDKIGAILASSMTRYVLRENHNMQLSLKKKEHQPMCAGLEAWEEGRKFSQCYDEHAVIEVKEVDEKVIILVDTTLTSENKKDFCSFRPYRVTYELSVNSVRIYGHVDNEVTLNLPIIGIHKRGFERGQQVVMIQRDEGRLVVKSNTDIKNPEPVFFLAGGFEGWKFTIDSDNQNMIDVEISVEY